jgi:hypothetical protein
MVEDVRRSIGKKPLSPIHLTRKAGVSPKTAAIGMGSTMNHEEKVQRRAAPATRKPQ